MQAWQKLWPHDVETGLLNTSRQMEQVNWSSERKAAGSSIVIQWEAWFISASLAPLKNLLHTLQKNPVFGTKCSIPVGHERTLTPDQGGSERVKTDVSRLRFLGCWRRSQLGQLKLPEREALLNLIRPARSDMRDHYLLVGVFRAFGRAESQRVTSLGKLQRRL
ncbi:hypothetical protein EYF80_023198 [Liparis tanakae]|uniref:Uncharacterized protein n=1 Tax=Liparis tanakae TaxID=230148 RepID=A0A4Z2HP03_9TELE|nr:hypothetical protein EYF80_023198 [Liparis tanakae]